MAPFRSTSKRSAVPASGPVFLDNSGRRLRHARVAGLAALSLVAGYVVLFFIAFFGGPDIMAPYLPKPAAVPRAVKPVQHDAPSSAPRPPAGDATQAGSTVPVTGAVPVGQAGQGIPSAPEAPAPAATVAPAAPAAPGSKAQAPATSGSTGHVNDRTTPASAAQGAGQQTLTEPGKSGTAPGQATRATPPSHP